MSNIIKVRDHLVPVPDSRGKEILFKDEKDPFWRRELLLQDYRDIWFEFQPHFTLLDQAATRYDDNTGVLTHLNKEDTVYIKYIYEQENRRRRDGVHFANGKNGEVDWITGDHYFALMWCQMPRHDGKGSYADYLQFQRDFFYLIYLAWTSPHILGCFWTKAKKTGITNMFWLYYLNRATLYRNKHLGYMNINEDDSAKLFRDYFIYAFNGLPNALRPLVKSKSEDKGYITFGTSYNVKKKGIIEIPQNDLNSHVYIKPTLPKVFDTSVMSDICFDEPTKYAKSFKKIWDSNKEGVRIHSKNNGRAWLFNYTSGEDTESFIDARKLFFASELKTILSGRNETASGLICDHIPAYLSWNGTFDKNGRSREVEAMEKVTYEVERFKDDRRAYQSATRAYANTKRQAWMSGGSGSTFDNARLADLLAVLEIDNKDNPENTALEAKLEWEKPSWEVGLRNKRRKGEFCNVKLVPLSEEDKANNKLGKIRIFYPELLNPEHFNSALKYGRDEWNNLLPPPRYNYCLGGDPTQYAGASEVIEGSKNAAYVISLPDLLADNRVGKIISKLTMIEYYDRPELPDEAFEDFLKLIIWLGALAEIEANSPYVATRLMEEGLGYYMIVKDLNGNKVIWQRWMGLATEDDKKYKLIRITSNGQSNKDQLELMVRLIKNRIEKPGVGEKDYGATEKSVRLLKQLMDVNTQDTRLYDLFMAYGYTLECLELYMDMLMRNQEEAEDPNVFASFLAALQY